MTEVMIVNYQKVYDYAITQQQGVIVLSEYIEGLSIYEIVKQNAAKDDGNNFSFSDQQALEIFLSVI